MTETNSILTKECPPAGTGPDGLCTTCDGTGRVDLSEGERKGALGGRLHVPIDSIDHLLPAMKAEGFHWSGKDTVGWIFWQGDTIQISSRGLHPNAYAAALLALGSVKEDHDDN